MPSLTRAEAQERAGLIDVAGYAIALDLTTGADTFTSVTTMRFACRTPGATSFVDVKARSVTSVRLNGVGLDPHPVDGRIALPDLQGDNELVVDAFMAYSHDGEGLHRHVDPADERVYVYAMSFLEAAPRWFACFDQPDLKAPVSLDVRCPPDWTVSGNGPATELEPGRWQVAATGKLATYFTTVVAGPYHRVRSEHDGIPLVLLARQSLAQYLDADADEILAITRNSFDELHRLFGVRYPWGEYHQAFVPEFNAGAMENPGCVTIRDPYVFRSRVTNADRLTRATTIAHEMAHMWFGDLVTMRWWDDLWLNESFAEYLGHRVVGEHTWADFGAARKSWGFAADRRPSTHPVAGNGAPDATSALNDFDGISYAKGASVLRQLALHAGDDAFLGGVREHIERHAGGNAELADLLDAWRRAGVPDLDTWAHAWLRTTGLDTLAVDGGELVRADGTRTHSLHVAALDASGHERGRARLTVAADRTSLPELPAGLRLPDAGDETWAKIVLAERDWAAMPALLPGVADAHTRVAIWNALQLAVADAEVDPALAVDIVVAALPADTDDTVLERVGRWSNRVLAGTYCSDGSAARARLTDAMRAMADGAEPGSGRQLAAVRNAVATSADVDVLRGWLAGEALPAGLVVDTELRWSIVTRLAALGAADEDEIAAAATADRSTHGAVHAARCRAARPDPAAKAAAWTAIVSDPDRPNYELYALAEGFWNPAQRELTDPYVSRYFAEIPETAKLRSGWLVEQIALLAYPWPAVDARTLDATEQLLERDDLHAGLRRSVIDAGDDLRRALAARTRFG